MNHALTKAGHWYSAKQHGLRLPERDLEPCCDLCGEPCDADDFNQAAGLFICTPCIEAELASANHARTALGMVGGGDQW